MTETKQQEPCAAALAHAEKNKFSWLASKQTIIEAYAAHMRLMAKIAARKAQNAKPR